MRQKIWRLRRNAGSTSTQLSSLTPLNLSSGSTASQHLLCKILFLLSNTAFVVVLHLTKKEWRMHSPITGQTHYPQTSFSVGCLNDIIPKKLHQNFDASTGHQVNFLKGLGFFHTPQTCWQVWKNPKPFKKFTWWSVEASTCFFTHLSQGSPWPFA